MLRKLFSLGNKRVGHNVRVAAILSALGPAAAPAIEAGGAGLGSGRLASQQRADVNLLTTVRAFHMPVIYPTVRYVSCEISK